MKRQLLFFSPDDPGGSGGENDPDPDDSDLNPGTPPAGDTGPGGQDDLVPRQELTRANREAGKYRKERNDLKRRVEELEGQSKTELERERDRAARAEQERDTERQRTRDLRVQVVAGRVGIVPEARADAARLLDWNSVGDPDDDASVETALRELVKDRTFLLGNVPGGADGGAGGVRDTESKDMNALLRQAAGR